MRKRGFGLLLFKIFSSKRFGEDVCNFLICGTMSQVNSLGLYMISNQMVLCVDVLGSIMESGFLANLIAEVLSTRRGVEFTCFSCKYSSIFLSHTISFVASAAATYSASVVESVGTDCLHDLQETTC
jgi:hypothetical protein